ncbi:nucleotidyltransferase family protein [Herbiconiux gentiana]|uniref:nucleotidyltransferase family protein n=1 Tax=Herbiconiux gentiana TaxID=2970912 RepID=UPI0035C6A497
MTALRAASPLNLRGSEAVPLVTGLVAKRLGTAGVDALIIKGLAAELQGLRAARTYADVDVIAHPAAAQRAISALAKEGWQPRVTLWTADKLEMHSVTLVHERWPCDIDVHHRFPGFLAPPGEVFDLLWQRREQIEVAHSPAFIPDTAASAAILGLHGLRKPNAPRSKVELGQLVERLRRDSALGAEVVQFAARAGCSETLAPVLLAAGLPVAPGRVGDKRALRDWHRRTSVESRTGRWLSYLGGVPWQNRPRELAKLLWPPQESLLQEHPEWIGHNLTASRVHRVLRGALDGLRLITKRPAGRS